MRTLYLLVLTCAFPFIALSQIQPDKAIIDDYAHPAFVQVLHTSGNKIIIQTSHSVYLAAAFDPAIFARENDAFSVLRKLSPVHAVIQLKQPSLIQKTAGLKFLLPAGNSWKLSPALMTAFKEKTGPLELIISVRNTEHFKISLAQFVIIKQEFPNNLLRVAVNDMAGQSVLISYDSLLFADLAHRKPKEELLVSGFDLGANRVNAVHHHYPAIHGGGLMVSVKENRFDSADIDLRGRVINSNLASPTLSGHSTIMATMLAGAGNSFYEGKGVAWKANLHSTSFANLLPEPDNYYSSQKISVQNHSYGTGIENYYGADASAYDASVINNPVLTHVFSSGNSGLAPGSGPYAGITGFANLTGSFKMAKNVLVIGATDSVGNVEGPSSRGPAYDGRIKPDLVAFGQDGSSGAAAIVSGIVLLMQDAYRKIHNDSLPPAALLKAILINSADDVGTAGPDYSSGYGSVNAYKAIKAINNSNHFSNNIQQGNSQRFNLQVPPGLRLLKITLTWTDPPAQANAFSALVNDLDLELVHLQSGNSWLPWTLSRFAHRDSLLLPAIRGRDSINNAEQITVENPPAGDYEINVKGKRISSSLQSYFISYGADTMNRFEWLYPMQADPVLGGTNQMLRWTSGYAGGTTGKLELSLTRGTSWETIESNADLSRNYIRFTTPDTFSTALVRMTTGGDTHTSDTFIISRVISTQVGFNCPDSFLFYWNKPDGVNSFRVYQMGNIYLQPVLVTSDTFFKAPANSGSRQFTIAPLVNNREGIRSYTFDYTLQGVECYFRSFLAQANQNGASLLLQLGSVFGVTKIVLQKFSGNAFRDLQVIQSPTSLQYGFIDAALHPGVNTYRVALQLADGKMIYSRVEYVYYLGNTEYILYPNPVRSPGSFTILQKEPNTIQVKIYDVTGRLVKNETHADILNVLNTAGIGKGMYIVVVEKEGESRFVGKIVVN